jgi:hypothetical protein
MRKGFCKAAQYRGSIQKEVRMRRQLMGGAAVFVFGTLLLTTTRVAFAAGLPANWILAGDHPETYTADVLDKTLHLAGTTASSGFGTAMQTISSANYRGKNVRFTAQVRSADVAGWAGLWMRVDGGSRGVLAFDNMQQRPIKGTTEWTTYSVVLPVPDSASDIAFGVLLAGSGNVWMKNLTFESVGSNVKPTSMGSYPAQPNLDLSAGGP